MDPNHNTETPPLSEAAVKFNSVLTFAQGFALVAIAVAALVGICSSIWSMVELEKASLGDLLLLFLYIEILSMVKGSALGTREIPIRTPVALAIVAVARYIVVDVEHMTPAFMLMTAGAILVLVCALWVLSHVRFRH
jgi:protein PsiE